MDAPGTNDEDMLVRLKEELKRLDLTESEKREGGFDYRKRKHFPAGYLAALGQKFPDVDVRYILTGYRTINRLPEFEERILWRLSVLNDDGRFSFERALDTWLSSDGRRLFIEQ